MEIRISENRMSQLTAQVVMGYPHEACGFLLGTQNERGVDIQCLYAGTNIETKPNIRFELSGNSFLEATQVSEKLGLELVGVYHSHPDAPAVPSPTDLQNAVLLWGNQPSWLYPIFSVVDGQFNHCRWWQLRDQQFQEHFLTQLTPA